MNWLKQLYIETVPLKKYLRLLHMVPSITTQPVLFFIQRRRLVTWGASWISMAFRCQLSVRLEESWPMSCQWMKLPVSLLTFTASCFWLRLEGQDDSDHTCLCLVHAAVIAINEAIDRGQAPATMAALNNPNAMLKNAKEALAEDYQNTLSQAKTRKLNQSSRKVRNPTNCDLHLVVSW